jgi:plasmid stabilization system protein ParE
MTYRVETSGQAENDANAILEWLISKGGGHAGSRWIRDLNHAIESLAAFPERCSVAPESSIFSFEVRQLLYGRSPDVYRILFTINGSTVYILHIRHGRRKPLSEG